MTSAPAIEAPRYFMPGRTAQDALIVALDLDSIDQARNMVKELDGLVDFFKVGLALQLAPGVEKFIDELLAAEKRVFLDYKYHDIPETVGKAVGRASEKGVHFLTIHGSSDVMKEAVRTRTKNLKLFVVTVLTSMDRDDLREMGYVNHSVEEAVIFRSKKAKEAGCDGVIASGLEVSVIKQLEGNLLVVTPGIRPYGSVGDDQKRKVTPSEAIEAGADYLVVGRPIIEHANPREAATAILAEMQAALDKNT